MTAAAVQPGSALARRAQLLARLRAERSAVAADLAARFAPEREAAAAAVELRRVAIVLGSPRGGTSAFHAALSRAGGALAIPGEHRPLLTLLGWNFPDHGGDGESASAHAPRLEERDWLARQLLFECRGEPIADPGAAELERFAWRWALRFRLQWPELDVELERVAALVVDACRALRAAGRPLDAEPIAVAALLRLRALGLPVDPRLYALPDAALEAFGRLGPAPSRPPSSTIVEISPYVPTAPAAVARPGESACLVVKASSDALRIPLLARAFAGWDVRWLHLTRNPLASINGLLDGWAHHCFWQHDLALAGVDGPRRWWCFDLFPGWRDAGAAPLERVAREQWLHPQERILADLPPGARVLRARFEEFQDARLRGALLEGSARFLDLEPGEQLARAADRPAVVNQTAAPRPGRWRARPQLLDALGDERVAAMAARLGYAPDSAPSWP